MRILITGSNGMLARSVIKKFSKDNELICTDVEELDITNLENVSRKVKDIKPQYIINCAAYTSVDDAENNYDLAYRINCIGPQNLAKAAKENNSTLIHISTDYVFEGNLEKDKTYSETDKANPNTVYGKTKLLGEKAIQEILDNYYIFRTAWLYGDGKNFVKTMINLGKTKDEINVVSDQYGSPTNADDLANIIEQAINKKIPYGIYHTTNLGFTTWFDFAKMIFKFSEINCKVNPVSTEEYLELTKINQAPRPFNSKLSKDKILNEKIEIPNWEDSLKKYLNY